jgi:hypothetical protein
MTHSFPKIIWQTHNYKKEDLPEHISHTAATWKNLNPGWEYRYVDHIQRDEMVSAYPEIYQTYKDQTPVFQSDIWRFLVTYEHGGCYADMDSVCVKPLDYLLQDIDPLTEIITVPKKQGYGNTHNYVVKPKSKAISEVFEKMNSYSKILQMDRAFLIFIKTIYEYEDTSQLFIVQTEHNSIEDVAAMHDHNYKSAFDISEHKVNNYGTIVKYLDFLNQKGLSPSI